MVPREITSLDRMCFFDRRDFMNLQQCRKEFIQYVKKFDLKEKVLMDKFHHTFRVMDYCIEIANSLHLEETDVEIAGLVGLLHDIGRFEQWEKYQTYCDNDSIDHADLGIQVLKENNFIGQFVSDIETQELILKAVKNHNKLEIESMSERELLFTKIIRDADKLDIMIEQDNQIRSKNPILNEKLVQSIQKHELCKDTEMNSINGFFTDEDSILRSLAFVFDIHFNYTLKYLQEKEIIENKINLLEIYFPDNPKVQEMKRIIIEYIEKRLKLC